MLQEHGINKANELLSLDASFGCASKTNKRALEAIHVLTELHRTSMGPTTTYLIGFSRRFELFSGGVPTVFLASVRKADYISTEGVPGFLPHPCPQ